MRLEIDEAFARVTKIYDEHREAFIKTFGRDPGAFIQPFETDDAETIFITSGTIATTTREIVKRRRANGEKIGMIKMKMFRPFPIDEVRDLCRNAKRIGVLDRNYGGNSGGVFGLEVKAALQGDCNGVMVQDYLTGVGGGDVTPDMVEEVIDDLVKRTQAEAPVWKGVER